MYHSWSHVYPSCSTGNHSWFRGNYTDPKCTIPGPMYTIPDPVYNVHHSKSFVYYFYSWALVQKQNLVDYNSVGKSFFNSWAQVEYKNPIFVFNSIKQRISWNENLFKNHCCSTRSTIFRIRGILLFLGKCYIQLGTFLCQLCESILNHKTFLYGNIFIRRSTRNKISPWWQIICVCFGAFALNSLPCSCHIHF